MQHEIDIFKHRYLKLIDLDDDYDALILAELKIKNILIMLYLKRVIEDLKKLRY